MKYILIPNSDLERPTLLLVAQGANGRLLGAVNPLVVTERAKDSYKCKTLH